MTEKGKAVDYIVEPGDTLHAIARGHGTTVEAIVRLNNLADPDQIRVGQRLLLPEGAATTKDSPQPPAAAEAAVAALEQQLAGRLPRGARVRPGVPLADLAVSSGDLAAVLRSLPPDIAEDLTGLKPDDVDTVDDLAELIAEVAAAQTVIATVAPRGHRPGSRAATLLAGQPSEQEPFRPQPRQSGGTRGPERPVGRKMEPKTGHRAATDRAPVRFTLRHGPEIDPNAPRYRSVRRGAGSCNGERQRMVQRAFARAYEVCVGAKNELDRFVKLPDDQLRLVWTGAFEHPQAALGFWFGTSVPARGNLRHTVKRIHSTVLAWERGFRVGRFGSRPVIIRCRRHPGGGDTSARHVPQNVLQLYDEFFDGRGPTRQAITLLHEMGHWAHGSLTSPRDERHALCSGGWNRAKNMCYRGASPTSLDGLFTGGNPRALAQAYDAGDARVMTVMLNNIDNFVSFMWNRYVDRGTSVLDVVVGAKGPGKPAPAAQSKPIT